MGRFRSKCVAFGRAKGRLMYNYTNILCKVPSLYRNMNYVFYIIETIKYIL